MKALLEIVKKLDIQPMLKDLVINNIVLIDEATISFGSGLCILTGETGSGKSILLDALSLAIGIRANNRLLRNGEKQGSVIATFDIKNNNSCKKLLKEQEIEFDDELILRRIISEDGKSKAFINNIPVSQSFLNLIGEQLVEIHGQHDQRGLLNPAFHRDILDDYGNLKAQRDFVGKIFDELTEIKKKYKELNDKKDNIEKEIDYLEYTIQEIDNMNIQENEEEILSSKRKFLMDREKITKTIESVKNAISGQYSIDKIITTAEGFLNRNINLGKNLLEDGKNAFEDIIDAFEKVAIEFNEANSKVDNIISNLEYNDDNLNDIEERLFNIRGLLRKLNITSEMLPKFKQDSEEKLKIYKNQNIEIGDLLNKIENLTKQYLYEATKLREQRKFVAKKLAQEITEELIPLKMEKVKFEVEFKELTENQWNRNGIDSIRFLVATNVGTPLDDLSKIASGGELSRFMLALKVVLSKINSVPTLIFDEIDTGVSGAVANAIGERLKKLGQNLQIFVITHLAQVASKGNHHFKIEKKDNGLTTRTTVMPLSNSERKIEIAKMISNENVTDEALKMAERLLNE